jgi:hypothetical protein
MIGVALKIDWPQPLGDLVLGNQWEKQIAKITDVKCAANRKLHFDPIERHAGIDFGKTINTTFPAVLASGFAFTASAPIAIELGSGPVFPPQYP